MTISMIDPKSLKQLIEHSAKLNGHLPQNIPLQVYDDALRMLKMGDEELKLFVAWKSYRPTTYTSTDQPDQCRPQVVFQNPIVESSGPTEGEF